MYKLLERQLAIAILVYHSEGNGSIIFRESQTAEEELILFEIQVAGMIKVHGLRRKLKKIIRLAKVQFKLSPSLSYLKQVGQKTSHTFGHFLVIQAMMQIGQELLCINQIIWGYFAKLFLPCLTYDIVKFVSHLG